LTDALTNKALAAVAKRTNAITGGNDPPGFASVDEMVGCIARSSHELLTLRSWDVTETRNFLIGLAAQCVLAIASIDGLFPDVVAAEAHIEALTVQQEDTDV